MIDLQNWADTYVQKLKECGYEDARCTVEGESLVLIFSAETPDVAISTLNLTSGYKFEMFHIGSIGTQWIGTINVDYTFVKPITDLDRLNNKLFKRNLSSPYDHHAKKFVETLKLFYNIDMSYEQYDHIYRNPNTLKYEEVYRLNNSVMVAKTFIEKQWVYIIHGSRTDRGLPALKTALPDLFNEKTLLPVPDKILMKGLDRMAFSKLVRQMVIEKKQYFQKVFEENTHLTDKEIFLSNDLTYAEKKFIKKLRKSTPEYYELKNAVYDVALNINNIVDDIKNKTT